MYAIVRVGGKQYRVEKGDSLLVDRLPEDEGAKLALEPLLYRSDKTVFDGAELAKVKVEAVVARHERGPKLRVFKFKPKRGYKRTRGHRAELTRIEVKDIKLASRRPAGAGTESASAGKEPAAQGSKASGASRGAAKAGAAKTSGGAKRSAGGAKRSGPAKGTSRPPAKESDDGS